MSFSTNKRRARTSLIAAVVTILAIATTACGGAGGGNSAGGVASLENVASASEETAADNSALQADEVALEFSQCMRDEGLDFPDVGVDPEGNPDIGEAFSSAGVEPRSPEFRDAMDVCAEILQTIGFGGGRGFADNTELQDAFVEYSECLRDEGLDVGDLQLGGPGGGGQGDDAGPPEDGAPQRGQGEGRGQFGDPTARIAAVLGLDAEDPETAAALDVCAPILDTALSQFGPGAQ